MKKSILLMLFLAFSITAVKAEFYWTIDGVPQPFDINDIQSYPGFYDASHLKFESTDKQSFIDYVNNSGLSYSGSMKVTHADSSTTYNQYSEFVTTTYSNVTEYRAPISALSNSDLDLLFPPGGIDPLADLSDLDSMIITIVACTSCLMLGLGINTAVSFHR